MMRPEIVVGRRDIPEECSDMAARVIAILNDPAHPKYPAETVRRAAEMRRNAAVVTGAAAASEVTF